MNDMQCKNHDFFFCIKRTKCNYDDKNDLQNVLKFDHHIMFMMTICKFKMTCCAKRCDNDVAFSMYKNTITYSILFSELFGIGQNGSLFEGNILALNGFC